MTKEEILHRRIQQLEEYLIAKERECLELELRLDAAEMCISLDRFHNPNPQNLCLPTEKSSKP